MEGAGNVEGEGLTEKRMPESCCVFAESAVQLVNKGRRKEVEKVN